MTVLLFTKDNAQKILDDIKDETRRLWTDRTARQYMKWTHDGKQLKLKTNRYKKEFFAKATVIQMFHEKPCEMDPLIACVREGYPTLTILEFFQMFCELNGVPENMRPVLWASGILPDGRKTYVLKLRIIRTEMPAVRDEDLVVPGEARQ